MDKNAAWAWEPLREYSLWILLVWMVIYLVVKLNGNGTLAKRFLALSAVVYAAVFLFVTLFGRAERPEIRYQLELFWEYREAFGWENGRLVTQKAEFAWFIVNNILLFIPLGVLLGEYLCKHRRHLFFWVLSIGCLVSISVEISQLVFQLGLFELDDVWNNSIGAALGFAFYALVNTIFSSKP